MIGCVHDEFGRERRVAVQWPTVLAAPSIVADSDLPMTVPRHAAEVLRHAAPIRIFTAPFEIPRDTVKVYSQAKHAHTDAHRWIRA